MNPRNLTRESIEQSNDIEPYCFETNREEQWFNVGLQYGLDVADSDPISPWIRVEDDLPCNHEELMHSFFTDKTTDVLVAIHGDFRLSRMIKWRDKWIWESYIPTYWMPIPKLPKIS